MEHKREEAEKHKEVMRALEKNLQDLRKYTDYISEMRVETALLGMELFSKMTGQTLREVEDLCGVAMRCGDDDMLVAEVKEEVKLAK